MSKKVQIKDADHAQDLLNEIALRSEEEVGITKAEIFEYFEKVPDTELQLLNADYLKFETMKPNTTLVLLLTGVKRQKVKGDEVDVVQFEQKDGTISISASAVLVNAAMKLKNLPAYVRVLFKGMKKGEKGSYADLEVRAITAQ